MRITFAEVLRDMNNLQKINHYLLKIRNLKEKAKYCPFCGHKNIMRAGHTTTNELVYACLGCKKGFSATNLGNDVVKND